MRKDEREYTGPLVPLNREQGERTDGVLQLGYDSGASWRTYGFVQDTLSKSEERPDNGRFGTGGSYRMTERFRVDAEVSDGDLGAGGRLGTNYLYSERTTPVPELRAGERAHRQRPARRPPRQPDLRHEAPPVGLRAACSSRSATRRRIRMSGLTHATGMTLAPNERWNFGANTDIGTLTDDADRREDRSRSRRRPHGLRLRGRAAVERRRVSTRQDASSPILAMSERTTWLFRNSFKFQLNPDWRVVGKFNHAKSESSLGQFYDGGYTEAVLGYGYRPVAQRPAERAGQVHVLLQRADDGAGDAARTRWRSSSRRATSRALDLTYDLTDAWSIGGKYAYRLGQVSLDRETAAVLRQPRAALHPAHRPAVRGDWEGLLEGRMLDMPDLNEQRSGALVAVYRYVGKHFKVGAGYNFTDFSEDLTDLSFRHEGVFINMIGSM